MLLNNWSYSRYGTWKKCPALLKFQMEDKGPRTVHPAADRGTQIHKHFEEYILGKTTELPVPFDYYREFLDQLKGLGAQAEVEIALDKDWKPVAWDSENRWWRGILDAYIPLEVGATVLDWKTGQEYPDHREQREIYAIATHSIIDVPVVDVYHVYVDKRWTTTTRFKKDEIPELKLQWEGKIEEMFNDRTFPPRPGFYCRSCPYGASAGGPCPF